MQHSPHIHRRDRPENAHGGVLIAAKRHLLLQDIITSKTIELISGSIHVGNKKICIATYYRPPNRTDSEYISTSTKELSAIRSQSKNSIHIIGGDFNLPDINWDKLSIESSSYPKRTNQAFLDLIADENMEQLVDFPTRKDKILDLILTSHPGYILRCIPLPSIGNSDHDVVLLDTSITSPRPRPQRRQIFLWKRANINDIKEDIHTFANTFLNTNFCNIDSMWQNFKDHISSIITKRVPTKLSSAKYTNPWMNTSIKRTIRRKQKAHKKARKTKTKKDKDRYKKLQKEVQWQIRKADKDYVHDIVSEDYKGKPKRFWSYVKSRRQESTGVGALKNKDGYLRSDSESKANILNQQFSSVFTKEPEGNLPQMGPSNFQSMPSIKIAQKGVQKLLKNLNCNKATGPDQIPNQILQQSADELAPILTKLYQYSLDTGTVPQDWREANVVPIYKKGDKHIPANYRPVSLTSVSCKLLEHIIHSNIMTHFDHYNILCDNQHGFRKKRSCESQLIVSIDSIAKQFAGKSQVDVVLLDFEKAFDKVPHSRLLHKLDHYGVRGPLNQWIRSFLFGRQQQVVLDNTKSTKVDVCSGVPQGSVLGPLLFLAYINDMPGCSSSDTRLFADDSLLYRAIHSDEDHKILQSDLDALEEWEKKWLMSFNPSKCYVLHISPDKRKTRSHPYYLHGQPLQPVDSSKYLGVTVSDDLSWDKHVQSVTAKGNRTLGFVKRNLKDCTTEVKAASYCTLVRPVLEYACTVWDPHLQSHINSLEQIQRRAARFVTGDYSSRTPGCMTAMLQRLEWDTLQRRREEARLSMLYRIHHGLVEVDREAHLKGDTRTRARFFQERIGNQTYANTFFPRTIKNWNHLPTQVTQADSLEMFRRRLATYKP